MINVTDANGGVFYPSDPSCSISGYGAPAEDGVVASFFAWISSVFS